MLLVPGCLQNAKTVMDNWKHSRYDVIDDTKLLKNLIRIGEWSEKSETSRRRWQSQKVAKVSADFGEAQLNESPGVFFYDTL